MSHKALIIGSAFIIRKAAFITPTKPKKREEGRERLRGAVGKKQPELLRWVSVKTVLGLSLAGESKRTAAINRHSKEAQRPHMWVEHGCELVARTHPPVRKVCWNEIMSSKEQHPTAWELHWQDAKARKYCVNLIYRSIDNLSYTKGQLQEGRAVKKEILPANIILT